MKVHSFVRTKASQTSPNLNFSNYLYYLFAPTLIYRDAYPRTNSSNWNFFIQCLLESISVLFIFTFCVIHSLPSPERWLQKFTISEVLLEIVEKMVYGTFALTGIFFLIFHSVQNLFAEILRFGDRLFYLDWWNEHSYHDWLSKWNKIVRDWLYYYVYRDFKVYVCNNSFLPRFVVFLVSFGVHEWVMCCWTGGFFPFMFLLFVTVVFPLSYYNPPKNIIFNVFLWFSGILLLVTGLVFYTLEWYARTKSPLKDPTLWDFVVPRFVTCDCVLRS